MSTVGLALLPCIIMACFNTGLQVNLAIESVGTVAHELEDISSLHVWFRP